MRRLLSVCSEVYVLTFAAPQCAWFLLFPAGIVVLYLLLQFAVKRIGHRKDGYYSTGDGTVYYHYGSDWYYTYDVNDAGYWYEADEFPAGNYEEYSLGEDWNSDWGVSDFQESSTWEALQESSSSDSSSSSDYDSWDSSGWDTDWDSDW